MATLYKIGKTGREILNNAGYTDEEIRVTVERAKSGKRVQKVIDQLDKGLNKSKGLGR